MSDDPDLPRRLVDNMLGSMLSSSDPVHVALFTGPRQDAGIDRDLCAACGSQFPSGQICARCAVALFAEPLLVITVHGTPTPAGSKTAFAARRKVAGEWVPTGKISMRDGKTAASAAAHKSWREAVRSEGQAVLLDVLRKIPEQIYPLDCALHVDVTVSVPRPPSHFGTGRNAGQLRKSAPRYPAGRPDRSKYLRAIEDALTDAGVWADDARIVDGNTRKRYAGDGRRFGEPDVLDMPGAVIRIYMMP